MFHAPCRPVAAHATVPQIAVMIALALAAMALSACRADYAFIGRWQLDTEALAQQPEFEVLEGKAREQALLLAQKMLSKVEVEVSADGTYQETIAGRQRTGHWKLVELQGTRAVLDLRLKQSDGRSEQRRVVFDVQGERARMAGGSHGALVLRRE